MRLLTLRARLALLVLVGVVPFLGFSLGSSYMIAGRYNYLSEAR